MADTKMDPPPREASETASECTEDKKQSRLQEEYGVWKEDNVPILYSFVNSTRLDPDLALTDVVWLPWEPNGAPELVPYAGNLTGRTHQLVVGSNGGEKSSVLPSYVLLVETVVPREFFAKLHGGDPRSDEQNEKIACKQYAVTHVRRRVPIRHPITKVTYNPLQPRLAAARDTGGHVTLIDWNKEEGDEIVRSYRVSDTTGFGIEWDPSGRHLGVTSYDKLVRVYDTNASSPDPVATFGYHTAEVEGLSWKMHDNNNVFVTCGGDGAVVRWDLRQAQPTAVCEGDDKAGVNCVAYNPHASVPHLLVSADQRGNVVVRDDRYLAGKGKASRIKISATREVTCLRWMTGGVEEESASKVVIGQATGRVEIYDVQQAWHPGKIIDTHGDYALAGTHYGHKSFCEGISCPPSCDLVADGCVASVEHDGMLQIWRFTEPGLDMMYGQYDMAETTTPEKMLF
eukprot:TRINITY_DN13320_c0_g1_i1.p1 TRINITY_DN13320_c0_g1~~TRINITY_DN13320_c0_g1_i1.p1  ORF type:complete len:457 (+),score=109.18 TRINITY_DN13320_c0_g1_i1:50-1420(+)